VTLLRIHVFYFIRPVKFCEFYTFSTNGLYKDFFGERCDGRFKRTLKTSEQNFRNCLPKTNLNREFTTKGRCKLWRF